jgi:hypothetical protein
MNIEKLPDGRLAVKYVFTKEAAKDVEKLGMSIEEMEDMLINSAKEIKEKSVDTTST